jgi:hypothetical protein
MERSRLASLAALMLALALPAAAGADATVHGDDPAHNREVAVAAPQSTLAAQERVAAQTAAASTGARTLAVILVNFANDSAQPFTTDQARAAYFTASNSVSAYYGEQSQGQVSFTGQIRSDGDVFGWYTIASTDAGCNWQTWGSQARAAAKADGHDTAGYDHVAVVFPNAPSCAWSGLGYEPGRYSYINGTLSPRTTAHEIGHNLGLMHASSYNCSNAGVRVTIGGSCSLSEYGDPFDVMGAGFRLLNGYHRAQAGWLGSGTTRTVTTSGDYLLAPLLPTGGGDKVIRIPRGDGSDYSLDFRQPFGSVFDTFGLADPVVNGVGLRVTTGPSQPLDNPVLLDGTPATSTFTDAALQPGASFFDAARGIEVATLAASPSGATVRVTFGSTTGATGTTTGAPTGTTTGASTGTTTGTTPGTTGTSTGSSTGTTGSTTGGTTGTTTGGVVIPPPPASVEVVALSCNRLGTTCTLKLRPSTGTTVVAASLGIAQRARARARRTMRRAGSQLVTFTLKPRPALRRGGRYTLTITLRGSDGTTSVVRRAVRAR